tara:strand:- start:109 stop:840 length:732 start_codon:yes stop_codon:yes gene_type:complete
MIIYRTKTQIQIMAETKKEEEPKKVEETKKAEEPKKEEPKKERKDMSLVEIVEDALKAKETEVELVDQVKPFLQTLLKAEAKHFENIEAFFKVMMEDKQITMKDVPACMGLLQELFLLYDKLKSRVSGADVGKTFKALIELMVLYRLKDSSVWTDAQREDIMKVLDTLISLSVDMMDLKETSKKMNSWVTKIMGQVEFLFACTRSSTVDEKGDEKEKPAEEVKAEDAKKEDGEKKEEKKEEKK